MSIDYLGIELQSPFIMAPMAGITDGAFRYICHKMGCGLSFTEMVSAKGLFYNSKGSEELMLITPEEGPVGIQFFGSEPDVLADAARRTNASPNVVYDINMGCPVPKIVRNGEGSALLKDPARASECVQAVVNASRKPVTVKFRKSFTDHLVENEIPIERFAELMEKSGASAIAVHGRTREQYYSGKADWDVIKRIKQAVSIPVIGNGDVFSGEDAIRMMDYTGCDLVMIARGVLGRPWIFREAAALYEGKPLPEPPEAEEIADIIEEQVRLAVSLRGAYVAVHDIRQHVGYYSKGMRGGAEFRRRANQAHDMDELLEIVDLLRRNALS